MAKNNGILPEHASIEAFVQFLMDDERDSFLPGEAQKVAEAMRCSTHEVIMELKGYGFKTRTNGVQTQAVRGFTSNPHGTPRFSGENSTFTTPGGSNICGFAGREGY